MSVTAPTSKVESFGAIEERRSGETAVTAAAVVSMLEGGE